MNDDRSIDEIFCTAIEIESSSDRQSWLNQACGDDAELRRQVDRLLEAHFRGGSIVDAPAHALDVTVNQPRLETPGIQIGPYKLLQQIGEGGMGTVFMAEQTQPVKRKVALKLIKAGMDSRQIIARFEAERQALAMMDHVNIARVLDAGATEHGRPYFVMELVHGVPITKYCDDNRLTPRQRLELFVPVCQAIQHAHQKGIIHRDIKPSNVMVTLYDGKPVPKVIDFGVAKATEQKLTERTLFTQYGTMVGTLEYMSPEQAEMSALGVDTRSDIFSLGVLLYELLTGSTPLNRKQMKEAAFAEILRLIKEEEPPKPSTRLSESGESLASISAQRHTEPVKLTKLMRGELDWIVMKCLEKDRNRRYETANGFAADVQRYLNDEPVQACPPSTAYRLRKFARRNKSLLATTTVFALALILGTGVSTWQAIRATNAEERANANYMTATEQRQTAETQQQRAEVSEQDARTNEGLAQAARKEAVESLKEALAAVDQMLTRVGQDRLANVPQMEPVRRELLQDALNFYQRFLQKNNEDPDIRLETAMAYRRLANMHRMLAEFVEAEQRYRKAFAMFEEQQAEAPLEPNVRLDLSLAHLEMGDVVGRQGRREEQEFYARRAVKLAEDLVQGDPKEPSHSGQLAYTMSTLAILIAPTRAEEAEKILRRSLTLTDDLNALAFSNRHLANFLSSQGRNIEAEPVVRHSLELYEQIALANPSAPWALCHLGETLLQSAMTAAANGRLPEAEAISARAISVLDKLATDFPASPENRNGQASAHQGRASLLRKLNRTAEAEQAYRRALDLFEKLAADFPTINAYPQIAFDQRLNFGQFLVDSGRAEDALDVYRQAIDLPGSLAGNVPRTLNHWHGLVRTHVELGRLLAKSDKMVEAETAYRRAAEIQEKLELDFAGKPEDRRDLAQSHYQTAILFRDAGRALEAEKLLGHAIPHFQKLVTEFPKVPEYRSTLAYAHNELGWFMRRANNGRLPEAEKEQRLSLALFEELATDFPTVTHHQSERAEVLQTIANLLRDRGDLAEARPLMESATSYARKVLEAAPQRIYYERLRRDHMDLANLLVQLGEPAAAEKSLRQALADCEKQVAEAPAEPDSRKALAETHIDLALFLKNAGRSQEAEEFYRLALDNYDKLAADVPAKLNHWQELVRIHVELGGLLKGTGKTSEAEAAYRAATAIHEKLQSQFSKEPAYRHDLARSHISTAQVLLAAGLHQEADKLSEWGFGLFDTLIADSPDAVEYRLELLRLQLFNWGNPLKAAGRLDEAEKAFRQAQELASQLAAKYPEVAEYRLQLAHAHNGLGHTLWNKRQAQAGEKECREALELFEKLAAEFPDTAEYRTLVANGNAQLGGYFAKNNQHREAEGAYSSAVEAFERLAADFPNQASYRAEIGWNCRNLTSLLVRLPNRFHDAEEMHARVVSTFEKLATEFSDSPFWPEHVAHALRIWAYDLWQTGRPKEGDKAFRDAITVLEKSAVEFPNAEPSHHALLIDTYRVLVRLLATTGDAQASEQAILEIITVSERHAVDKPSEHAYRRVIALAQSALGSMFKTQVRIPEAEQAYDRAREVLEKLTADFPAVTTYRDDLILTHCDLGDLLQSAGRNSEAQTAYTRAVGLNPTAPPAWFKRAAAFGAMGQWEQAAGDISKVVEADPKNAVGHNNLAWLLATCPDATFRDPARAVELARKAVELAPTAVGHWNTLGVAQYRAGDWPATIEALTKSMELRNGGDAFDWYFLAMAHWQLNKKDEARKWHNQAVEWMEKNKPEDEELLRFRTEAAALLGDEEKENNGEVN